MKKIVFLVSVLIIGAVSANAAVDTHYAITPQYFQNTGYSAEVSKMVGVTTQDPYREPYERPNDYKTIGKKVLNYIAPGTYTDFDFYNHNIQFDYPSWNDF